MLVVEDETSCVQRVPVQIGTSVIASVARKLSPKDLKYLDETWKQTYVRALIPDSF